MISYRHAFLCPFFLHAYTHERYLSSLATVLFLFYMMTLMIDQGCSLTSLRIRFSASVNYSHNNTYVIQGKKIQLLTGDVYITKDRHTD
jgi:hypothetical protein